VQPVDTRRFARRYISLSHAYVSPTPPSHRVCGTSTPPTRAGTFFERAVVDLRKDAVLIERSGIEYLAPRRT